jgi:hypothetical protein
VVVVVVVGAAVVVLVVVVNLLVTLISWSNCLDICQSRLDSFDQPICFDGIDIFYNLFYPI